MAEIKHSSASNLIRFTLKNSSTGVGLTGLSSASAGLIISTIADNEATATAYTVTGSTIETIATLGTYAAPTATKCRFKEVDATNHKGLYEFQFADARFSVASAKRLVISVTGATNLLDADYEIQLVSFDPYDAVRMGMTALPNAAAEAAGGLYTRGTGAGQIAQDANGNVRTNLDTIKTQTVTCAAGVTVLASVGTAATDTAQTGDAFARLGAPVGASISADIATNKTHLTDIKGATWSAVTDTLEAIRDRGDAAWITATGFSTHSAADVWAVATRVLTAGTNIALAKGTGVTGFNDIAAADILTTALTEAYAADGAAFTLSQGFYMLWASLSEFAISGTTITAKKLDGITTAMTFTLNDGTNPTSRTRAT